MKTARVLFFWVSFALLSCAACNQTKPTDDLTAVPTLPPADVVTVPISLEIIVSGLEANDIAEIQLAAANEQTASAIQLAGITLPSLRLHNQPRTINLPAIPVGWYQITLSAPPSYFREPLGYLFQVQESGIVNRQDFPLPFRLIPESAQDLPPCRDVAAVPAYPLPPEEQTGDIPVEGSYDTCRAECMIDISSPPKLPIQQNTADATQNALQTTSYQDGISVISQ